MKHLFATALIALALPFSPITSADDSDVVELKSASSFFWSGAGQAGRAITVRVRVKNIGYDKNVYLSYNAGGAGWQEVQLSFSSHHGNYDLFTYNTSFSNWTGSVDFAVRYEVNGESYWNNNDGQNYQIGAGDDFIIDEEVTLNRMDANGYRCAGWMGCTHATHLTGQIYVENLYYDKTVGVRCSSDGENWNDINATYTGPVGSHVERWSFDSWDYAYAPGSDYPVYTCAVFFDDYWDNNFMQDYAIQNEEIDQLR